MSLPSVFQHNGRDRNLFGYVRVDLDPNGPSIAYRRTLDIESHSCFHNFETFLQTTLINATVTIGCGNNYNRGLIISPVPKCTHYKLMIVGVPREKSGEIKTHDDFIVTILFIPVEAMYPHISYIDIELEILALIQQYNKDYTDEELCDEILRYLEWRFY